MLLINKLSVDFWNQVKKIFALLGLVATVLGGIYLIAPNSSIFGDSESKEKKYLENISHKDSLIQIKDSILTKQGAEIETLKKEIKPAK